MRGERVHYEVLVAVVEHGSVTEAARVLGLPRATTSRHLTRLEQELGVALVTRTTRRIRPTAAGEQLCQAMRPVLESWRDAEDAVQHVSGAVSGRVRLSVLPLVTVALAPALARLAEEHPALQVEVVANVRLVDLRDEDFDAAIWAGDLRDPDLVSRRLAVGGVGLVATPGYLERHGRPGHTDDLASHRLLRGHDLHGQPRRWWPCFDGSRVRVDGSFVTNDARLLRAAVLEGMGIALISDLNVGPALHDGRLERVLDGVVGTRAAVRLVTARRDLTPTRLRVVLDAIASHFEPVASTP